LKGNKLLRRTVGHSFLLFPAAFFGGLFLALIFVLPISIPSAVAQSAGPFAEFTGSWSGAGQLRPQNGAPERIRCNATYRSGGSKRDVELQLRCASDSYNFDLVGQFTADDQNQVSGRWTERSRSTGGTAIGNAQGDRLQLHIESAGFAAEVIMVTRNRKQSVDIDSHGAGQVVRASITLNRS
jgi:hypothetical protein